jgi:hypothetical protein
LACIAALTACGSATTPAAPALRLTVARPLDGATTLSAQVVVHGTVAGPGAASVLVGGRPVRVTGGAFDTAVPVRPGANVIDVLAGAPGAREAMSAIRVYRELPVLVPRVDGQSAATASAALRRLGLTPRVHDGTGFFQKLLFLLSKHVCSSSPAAGRWVAPGSTVALQIAKIC